MAVEIRPYRSADYEELKQNLQQANMFDPVWDRKENLQKMIENDPEAILVAVQMAQVVGSVYLLMCGWEGFVFRLVVRELYRRSGIGTKILSQAEATMKKKGIREVALFVNAADVPLQRFYTDLHYDYGAGAKPHVVMWKNL